MDTHPPPLAEEEKEEDGVRLTGHCSAMWSQLSHHGLVIDPLRFQGLEVALQLKLWGLLDESGKVVDGILGGVHRGVGDLLLALVDGMLVQNSNNKGAPQEGGGDVVEGAVEKRRNQEIRSGGGAERKRSEQRHKQRVQQPKDWCKFSACACDEG